MTTSTVPPPGIAWRGDPLEGRKRQWPAVEPLPSFPPGTPWRADFSGTDWDRWFRGATEAQRRAFNEWGARVIASDKPIGFPDQSLIVLAAPVLLPPTPPAPKREKVHRAPWERREKGVAPPRDVVREREEKRLGGERGREVIRDRAAARVQAMLDVAGLDAPPTSAQLRGRRDALGLTQRAAAALAHLTRWSLSTLESDARQAPETRLRVWRAYQEIGA